MSQLRAWSLRFAGLFRKQERDRELADELESHLQMHIDDNIRSGMNPAEARRQALIKLGGVEQTKESYRDRRSVPWLETLLRDVRFGLRMLRKNPGFTVVAVLTLALGIGTNAAIFSVVNTVLLQPVRAPEPQRVVVFTVVSRAGASFRFPQASEIEFNAWREQAGTFQDVSGYWPGSFYLKGSDQTVKADAIFVTEDYFRLFGLPIAQGLSFTRDEEQPNGRRVVVLSDAFWKRAFGSDPHIIGKAISLSGDPYEVVGIMAKGIQTENLEPPDIWLPFPIDPSSENQVHNFQAVGRLKPGVTLDMAKAELQIASLEFRHKFPDSLSASRGEIFSVEPMQTVLVRDVRTSLLVLMGAVGFVLLIACANLTNLLLVRAAARTQEIAVRLSLGATRQQIIRQLLTESMVLSALGGALGLGLGFAGIRAVLALNPYSLPRIGVNAANVKMNWQVLAFTLSVALLTGILFGLIPAFQASRTDLNASLKGRGGQSAAGLRQNMARSLLVISQMGLALLLLIGAGLFIRTLIAVRSVNPGFDPHNVVTVRTTLDPRLAKTTTIDQIIQKAVLRISSLPGVEAAASTNLLPLEGLFNSIPITVVGRPLPASSRAGHGNSRFMTISPGYFGALKIPLVRGRLFTDADGANAPGVAIVNQAMARKFWPDGDPLNTQIFIGKGLGPNFDEPARQIVGIVADVHDDELDRDPEGAVFIPIAQRLVAAQTTPVDRTWVVRVRARSVSLDTEIQNELRQTIGGLPVPPLHSMEEVTTQSTARQSFNMLLMSIFGGSALLLAAIGIYGVMAYLVVQRTHEIGIRMSLGARPMDVSWLVLNEGARLALTGILLGIIGALLLTRLLKSFLYGVAVKDPLTFILAPFLLICVALLACYFPARRATKVDPMVALRHE